MKRSLSEIKTSDSPDYIDNYDCIDCIGTSPTCQASHSLAPTSMIPSSLESKSTCPSEIHDCIGTSPTCQACNSLEPK
jgi:hypothetical protein